MKKSALIIGDSGGLGAALGLSLGSRPEWHVDGLSRSRDGLDLCDETALAEAADARAGVEYDLIFIATGILGTAAFDPEKSFKQLSASAMRDVFAATTIGPALAIKHFAPLLARDRRSVFTALSARVGSIGDNRLGGWMSYRASKSALNQIMHCAAIEFARSRKHAIFACLHPGTVETSLSQKYARGRFTASPMDAAQSLLTVCENLSPCDNGGFFDYTGAPIPW